MTPPTSTPGEMVERVARAAIAAMREPSYFVVQAGFDAEATSNPYKTQPHHVVPAVWRAMIDAALQDDAA